MNSASRIDALPLVVFLMVSSPISAAAKEVRLGETDLSHATTGWGEVAKGRDAGGGPLRVRGTTYPDGVGVHAPSAMVFRLDGGAASFSALVGVDDAPERDGSVVFEVVADGETVFDSGRMSKGDEPKKVEVDISGRKIVTLRVTDAGDGIDSDHGDWLNAVFTVEGAAPVLAPGWMASLSHYNGPAEPAVGSKPTRTITSPGGAVVGQVIQDKGRTWVRVMRDGRPALDASPVGVTVDGVDLGKNAVLGAIESISANETYPWLGNQRTLTNHYKGERIAIKTGSQAWTLEVRAYDDGVTWRCVVPGGGKRNVSGEATSFAMPAGTSFWTHTNTVTYEANIRRYDMGGNAPKTPVIMPVTVELPGGGYACYTESDIMGYSGMTLGANGHLLNGVFEDDPQGWSMDGDFATPWRVVIAVADLDGLVNSSIVQSVCPPPDPKLFPKGILTDWIKPGRSYWTWGFGSFESARWERIKGYVDDAAALNCQYYTIDDPWRDERMGWHQNGGDEWDRLKEVCQYAAGKNVGIVVWQHWSGIRDLDARKEFFRNIARAGAKGVKIDFMESESQDRLEFYRSCLEIAAKHRLLVNFHGANKPAGEQRTWPNGLTREGIFGMEQRDGIEPQHWAALPFTRFVSGAGDFTPAGMPPDRLYGGTTMSLQLAAAIIYTSPIEHWMDSAEVYLKQPPEVVEFIRTKPPVWDETRVLPGNKIGELAAFARRSGDRWWIGVLNGTDEEKTYEFALDFHGQSGARPAIRFEDTSRRDALSISKDPVNPGTRVSVKLAPRGGFVMMLGTPE